MYSAEDIKIYDSLRGALKGLCGIIVYCTLLGGAIYMIPTIDDWGYTLGVVFLSSPLVFRLYLHVRFSYGPFYALYRRFCNKPVIETNRDRLQIHDYSNSVDCDIKFSDVECFELRKRYDDDESDSDKILYYLDVKFKLGIESKEYKEVATSDVGYHLDGLDIDEEAFVEELNRRL